MIAIVAMAAAAVVRLDVPGRAVLVEHVPAAESVRIEVAFPAGYARAEWPSLGAVYWQALGECIAGADGWPLEATVEADAVRLSGIAPVVHLPDLLAALRAAIANPGDCGGVEIGASIERWTEHVAATPAGRLRRLAAKQLFVEGDPRRDPFGDGLSHYADVVELESLRDRVVGLRGAVISVLGACDGPCALRAAGELFPDPPWGVPPAVAPLPPAGEPPTGPIRDTLAALPQHHVGLARLAPGAASPDWPAFLVVDLALYRRLHARLREREGRVYAVLHTWRGSSWPDLWLHTTMVRPAGADAVVAAMREVVAELRAKGLTAEELTHLRAILRGELSPDDPVARARLEADTLLGSGGRAAIEAALTTPLDVVNTFAGSFLAADTFVELRLAPADVSER